MRIWLDLPDALGDRVAAPGQDLSEAAFHALVIDAYRMGRLTEHELREVLDLPTRDALDGFLKAHGVPLDYSVEDVADERALGVPTVAGHGLALSGVIAVADASPLHYLILIGHIDLLPTLFSRILVPPAVLNELRHPQAPRARARVGERPTHVARMPGARAHGRRSPARTGTRRAGHACLGVDSPSRGGADR